jgi:MFS family permease
MSLKQKLSNYFQILPDDHVPPEVAQNFRHNFTVNMLDSSIWLFGDSFISISTILPVFAATLTDSPLVIGLIPALLNAGWFLPQVFTAGHVQRLPKLLPFTKKMAVMERIPYTFFPLLIFLLPVISRNLAVWIFILLIAWRGFASGFVALPWQEVIARVIPISHRARYFGISRLAGQILGVVGSVIAAVVFSLVAYPINYAISFSIALVITWLSYAFFTMNREPVRKQAEPQILKEMGMERSRLIDLPAFRQILKSDKNFVFYLVSRSLVFMGNMAAGFLAVYAIQRFTLADDQAAIFTGLLFVSGVVGNAVWGSLGDKIGPKRVLFFSGVIWSAAILLAILSKSIWMYYGVFLLMGMASSGSILGDLILVMELGDDARRPTYLGLARTLPGIFLLIAPLLAGVIVNSSGYLAMFVVTLVFMAIGLLLLLRVKDRQRIKSQPTSNS